MTVMFDSAITELKHRQFISSYNNFVNLAKNEENQFKAALCFLLAAECKKRQDKAYNNEIFEAGKCYNQFAEKNNNFKGKVAYQCAAKCFSQVGKYEDATKATDRSQKIVLDQITDDRQIIIIEDSEAITIKLKSILEKLGCKYIQSFKLGKDAIEKSSEFLKLKNLVVLLDIGLPDISGSEVANILLEKKLDLKIIVIAADDRNSKETHETISRGISAYIQKPFTFDDISKTLESIETEDAILDN